ncbi:hypothetical protein [Hymenobacter daecheongensis]|uniref:hypothetical protein n=1 Tax=Hymenobacter daecheongensis TaxID=496053 RepID=UPI0011614FB8|nr:hypothetical protein [Hymenobacter daecheongensis]
MLDPIPVFAPNYLATRAATPPRLFRARPASPLLAPMRAFLTGIGIETEQVRLHGACFLPGLRIDGGRLLIDPARLQYPGDVLHEAGHLALTPAAERAALHGNVVESQPEREGDEMAVMLWSYAACQALNLPPEVVFHPSGYHGQSAWILDNYRQNCFIGLPLLVWMGLTTPETFPRLTRWLRA